VRESSETDALTSIVVPAASAKASYLAVMLHGVGDSAEGFAPIARVLASQLPDLEFVIPDGLAPFDGAPRGRQWFSVRGVTTDNRAARVSDAARRVSAWIDGELARRGLTGDKLVLLGFSQGAIVSNTLAIVRSPPPHAVVAMSGRLAIDGDARSSGTPRVLVLHGTDDPVMPIALAEEAAAGLRARGAEVSVETFPGLAHSVDERELRAIVTFLSRP
jgi:phospholipase/carboxylesterase